MLAVLGLALAALGSVTGCEDDGTPAAATAPSAAPAETPAATQPPATRLASNDAPAGQRTAPTSLTQTPANPAGQDPAIPVGPPPPISFDPPSIELGILSPGDKRSGTVQIRNLSDAPLRIITSRSSCKCTAIDLANVVIPPHGAVPLTATMEPDTQAGPKKSKVRVAFEGFEQLAEVDINAEVALPVRCNPAYLNCVKRDDGTIPLSGTIDVTSQDGKPFRILSSNQEEPEYVDFDSATDAPRSAYTIRWDLTGYSENNCDEWPGWWLLETDHEGAAVVDVYIRHLCTIPKKIGTRRWLTTSQRALLGLLDPGESAEFSVSLLWAPSALNHDDHVTVAVSRSTDFDVELVSTDYNLEDPEIKLRVTPREGYHGLIFGVIELHSLHGHMAEYTVIGRVDE
jgi:hypothetical protein